MNKKMIGVALFLAAHGVHGLAQNTFPASGNVGIGTTSPGTLLDVNGPAVIGGMYFGDSAINTTSGAGQHKGQIWYTGSNLGILAYDNGVTTIYSGGGSNPTPSFTVAYSGNVGIGTTDPQAILDVASGYSGQSGPIVGIQIDGPNTPANANSAQDIKFGFAAAGSAHIRAYRGGSWDTYLQFLTNGVNQGSDSPQVQMTIDQAGNVGIGTTSPGAKFEVDGNVKLTSGSGASITFADGTVQSTAYTGVTCGGDYAESVNVAGVRASYEPGDVLVIGPDTGSDVVKSSEPYSTSVTGVYSTKPGVVGRRQTTDPKASKTEVPMAMIGIVPTKASAENGAIKRGDLLVTSSTPGYAMKGTDRSKMLGAVIGKALGNLDSGTGVIEAVITLQ
jgi:hypothetical protein